MSNPYEIDWSPPDISKGASMLLGVLQQNKANARADEYAQMEKDAIKRSSERESAALARQKAADEHKDAVERWNALPTLYRAAANSVPGANANPYNVHFSEGHDLPANVEPAAPVSATPDVPPASPDPTIGQHAGSPTPNGYHGGGMDAFGEDARRISADNVGNVGAGIGQHADASPPQPLIAQAAMAAGGMSPGPEGKRRIYASVAGGSPYEVPEQHDTTGLGPKYDAIYQTMLAIPGVTQQHAMDKVMADYEKDQAESGRNTRMKDMLGFRNTNREDQQTFQAGENEKYRSEPITIADRDRWNAANNRARTAAAGATTSPDIVRVLQSVEEGVPLSETAGIAAKAHIPTKAYAPLASAVVRNAAAGERAGQKREALTATDDHNNVIGVWKDANAAKTGSKQIESYHRVKERLAELIKDIESQGDRVISANSKDYQQRLSKAKAVVAALRPFNELSNTAAGAQMEEDIVGAIGTPGHGWLMGANADIIKRLATEAEGQHQAQLSTKLRPGGGSQLAPALGGRKGHGGGQVDAARKWLADNPDADAALRSKVEAKIRQLEGGGG